MGDAQRDVTPIRIEAQEIPWRFMELWKSLGIWLLNVPLCHSGCFMELVGSNHSLFVPQIPRLLIHCQETRLIQYF